MSISCTGTDEHSLYQQIWLFDSQRSFVLASCMKHNNSVISWMVLVTADSRSLSDGSYLRMGCWEVDHCGITFTEWRRLFEGGMLGNRSLWHHNHSLMVISGWDVEGGGGWVIVASHPLSARVTIGISTTALIGYAHALQCIRVSTRNFSNQSSDQQLFNLSVLFLAKTDCFWRPFVEKIQYLE